MIAPSQLLDRLDAGEYAQRLGRIYCCSGERLEKEVYPRIRQAAGEFGKVFPAHKELELFSAPGRTELGGNHTDHQHGCVLAASVNLDVLAAAAPNEDGVIRVLSQGYPMEEISLADLTPREEEKNTSAALIRGIAARIGELGYPVKGFDAYMTSNVLAGSGLSSSAAYEVMLGVILNRFSCGGALTPVQIAQIGQYAENVFFGKPCGLMDQMASSVGGAVSIDFADPAAPVIRQVAVDLAAAGLGLCIIDSGADHADLTDEYAAITREMKDVCDQLGCSVLRDGDEAAFWRQLPQIRQKAGDRAVLRAIHFFAESPRAIAQADALAAGDFGRFLELVKESGRSSYMYLQNVSCWSRPREQAVPLALAAADRFLEGEGAVRVHGGGFAGTIQAFVPLEKMDDFCAKMEAILGEGRCHRLSIRPEGGITLLA